MCPEADRPSLFHRSRESGNTAGNITRFPLPTIRDSDDCICAADQTHLRSHSGLGSGEVFHGSSSKVEFQLQIGIVRTLFAKETASPVARLRSTM